MLSSERARSFSSLFEEILIITHTRVRGLGHGIDSQSTHPLDLLIYKNKQNKAVAAVECPSTRSIILVLYQQSGAVPLQFGERVAPDCQPLLEQYRSVSIYRFIAALSVAFSQEALVSQGALVGRAGSREGVS